MPEGIIMFNNSSTKSGFIRGNDGNTYTFGYGDITASELPSPLKNQRVTFDADGEQARNISFLSQPTVASTIEQPAVATASSPQMQSSQPARSAPAQPEPQHTRFLNPYNFVRSLTVARPNEAPLLGQVTPPPHDRFIGLTGRMVCRLTATTPLFISDSHDITREHVNEKEHAHYHFFRDPEGNVAIPGTSLRGVIRSVFEAATNSCFSNFNGVKRLSYHLPPEEALKLIPARVRQANGQWELELLPGMTAPTFGRRPSGPQYAAWIHTYTPLWASQTVRKVPSTPYALRSKVSLGGWHHGERCQAIVELIQHPLRRFEFWNVVALAKPGTPLPKPSGTQRLVDGYLCITNQNIENKHDERLFFHDPNPRAKPITLALPEEVRPRYSELIQDYKERHAEEVDKRAHPERPNGRDPGLSRFIIDKTADELRDGDLVYAMIESKGGQLEVEFVVPVSVPRLGYDREIGELLYPTSLRKCEDYDRLCPGCRMFGWVWDPGKPGEIAQKGKRTAYAGRIAISHAQRVHETTSFEATLAILSTPKPTTTRFYLSPKNGKPRNGLPDEAINYNSPNQKLRGRKFYRHHGAQLDIHEYTSLNEKKSDQNRTVHMVQDTGTIFEFTIDFENLSRLELGALLWSIELEGWHHRIGFGKPLGFGSAIINVVQLEIVNTQSRYSSLEQNTTEDQLHSMEHWKQVFTQAMEARYGKPFAQLDNIRDLHALLAQEPLLPIHYPRPTFEPHPDGKNYEWFVGNNRSGRNAGPQIMLPLADEDSQGLPYIDRFGDEQT